MNKEGCVLIKIGYLNFYIFLGENESIIVKKRYKIFF